MMKSLVVYSSQTGNTRKLAEAVFEALSGEKEILPVDDAPDPSEYDLIAVGFWLKGGTADPKSAEYLGKVTQQAIFLFAMAQRQDQIMLFRGWSLQNHWHPNRISGAPIAVREK